MVRPQKLDDIKTKLDEMGVTGVTITEVRGAGRQHGVTQTYRGSQYTINLLPKVKIEVVVTDDRAQAVAEAIMNVARTGEIGDGKIFLIPILNAFRIRTGDEGETAIQ